MSEGEMVSRVAKAIFASDTPSTQDADHEWLMCSDDAREEHMRNARAAIEAMREPTEAMKHASENIHWGYSCPVCGGLTEGWQAMIDAALHPTTGSRE